MVILALGLGWLLGFLGTIPADAPWLGLGATLGVMGWFFTLGFLARRQQALLVAWRARLFRGLGLGLLGLGLWGVLRLASGG